MNSVTMGWRLGGRTTRRLAILYTLIATWLFYMQSGLGSSGSPYWNTDKPMALNWLGSGVGVMLTALVFAIVPVSMAWLAGSVAGAITALLAGWMEKPVAAMWGAFSFGLPSLLFHALADLRPTLIVGSHWLNAYWFWIGLPTLLCVLAGTWVGTQLSTPNQSWPASMAEA